MESALIPRDPVSSLTHMGGAMLSVAGLVVMIVNSVGGDSFSGIALASSLVFGISLIALYSASAVYHFVKAGERVIQRLRKLDHSMIYVLIAGTYTPMALGFMQGGKSIAVIAAMWGAALAGTIFKLVWINAPRVLYTLLYLAMGWPIVFDFKTLASMPGGAVALLFAGGAFYSAGAVFYILKKPSFSKHFGFHELFHVCVMLGSLCHFFMVFFYVIL